MYRSVIDTLGNLGVAAAQHVSLIRARLEAHAPAVIKDGIRSSTPLLCITSCEAPDVQVRRSAATAMGKMGAAGVPSATLLYGRSGGKPLWLRWPYQVPMLVLRLEEDSDVPVKRCAVEDGRVVRGISLAKSDALCSQALGSLGAFSKPRDCIFEKDSDS